MASKHPEKNFRTPGRANSEIPYRTLARPSGHTSYSLPPGTAGTPQVHHTPATLSRLRCSRVHIGYSPLPLTLVFQSAWLSFYDPAS